MSALVIGKCIFWMNHKGDLQRKKARKVVEAKRKKVNLLAADQEPVDPTMQAERAKEMPPAKHNRREMEHNHHHNSSSKEGLLLPSNKTYSQHSWGQFS